LLSAEMEGENQPEKRLKLDDANNDEQDAIKWLKKMVEKQKKMLASKNKKLLEMKESKTKMEREKVKVEREKEKVERGKRKVEREKGEVEREKIELKREKDKVEREKGEVVRVMFEVEMEKRKLKREKDKVEREKGEVEREKFEVEMEKEEMEKENDEMEQEKDEMEQEKDEMEREKNEVERKMTKVEDEKLRFEEKLRKLVECPVCLTLPRIGPVPCCANGHLVCSTCLERMRGENNLDCPTCREPFGEGKSLLAFAVAEQVQHECSHQGCTKTTPLERIVQHEKDCKWRPVLCPGSGVSCTEMIPFCKVEAHVQGCKDSEWPPIECPEDGFILEKGLDGLDDLENYRWSTDIIQFGGKLFFFCRVHYEIDGNFTVDMVMKGNQEESDKFLIKASIVDPNSEQTVIKAIYPPRPMKGDNKPSFCLTIPQALMSRVLKYNEESNEYCLKIHVKIVKRN